jgi:beta-xylosidase
MQDSVFSWARASDATGNAAPVIERDDASGNPKFYFYAPVEGGQPGYGISIGVAVADRPEGPFRDARGIPLVFLDDTAGTATHAWRNLDPAVFVDDDGQTYLYWGNGVLYWVALEQDMIHLKGETYTTDTSGRMQNRDIGGVQIHVLTNLPGYTEAPWLSKHDDVYYLTYASGFPESISYATSASPEGPWQHRGVILDRGRNSSIRSWRSCLRQPGSSGA